MGKFKTVRNGPSYYNDGMGSVNIYDEENESNNVKIHQDNCVINEAQIIKLYEFIRQNPQIESISVYNKKYGSYEKADEDIIAAFRDKDGKKFSMQLSEIPDAENPELAAALADEPERLKREEAKRKKDFERALLEKNNPYVKHSDRYIQKHPVVRKNEGKAETRVQFLGGNNEYRIGASSIMVEHSEPGKPTARILIDDGAMFPPDWINYDSAIPDMRPYFENPYGKADKPIDAIFVTHCHEDHIGALTFLAAAKFKLPTIYTSEYTARLIREQMKNNSVPEEFIPQIKVIHQGESVEIGDNMRVSPMNVSHSTAGPLAFHVATKTNDGEYKEVDILGAMMSGDYHLDKVPFGAGYNKEDHKEFMKDKFVNVVMQDSTSSATDAYDENGEKQIPDFDKAYENALREVQKHADKQIFSPVIARSVENLAIDIKAAAETGRTILIGSRGLRQAVKDLLEVTRNKDKWIKDRVAQIKQEILNYHNEIDAENGNKVRTVISNEKLLTEDVMREANAITDLMRTSSGELIDLEKVIYNAHDLEHTDIEKYLSKYPHEQRYMIISGAFAEDKNGRKSTLVMISEQEKVTKGKDGKVKGKGMTGHPLFTADERTLFFLRQRPIESINGPQHRAVVARLQSLGSTVIMNGDSVDEKYQRTGHATLQETQEYHETTVKYCKNHQEIENGTAPLYNVAVHGDPEQLTATAKALRKYTGKPMLCFNSDVLVFTPEGMYKEKGIPFEQQEWLCVQAMSIAGSGSNNLFVFDLCDHNLMQKEHLFTVINMQSAKGNRLDKDYMTDRMIENAEKLIEDEGGSMSNAVIRFRKQNKDFRGKTEEMSYEEYKEMKAREPKGKFNRKRKFSKRGGKGYEY
ncbi:MAG: MBL fold metallo-hydrolase [Alphaproteobacteria bacterium]|nr:MBL fold metallo-hydrolase [Alphaproteobacteria bacterium]